MNDRPSLQARTTEKSLARWEMPWRARAWNTALLRTAVALGALAAPGALASDSVLVSLRVTVVPVCRFQTSTVRSPSSGSATLTYSCSKGTAAAFSFAVAAATNVACAACSGIPVAMGTVQATSIGTGHGMGSGSDRTLSIRAPLTRGDDGEDRSGDGPLDTIIVTVSP